MSTAFNNDKFHVIAAPRIVNSNVNKDVDNVNEKWSLGGGRVLQNGNHTPCLEGVSAIQHVIAVQLECPTKVRSLCSFIYCLIFKILVHTPNATVDQIQPRPKTHHLWLLLYYSPGQHNENIVINPTVTGSFEIQIFWEISGLRF